MYVPSPGGSHSLRSLKPSGFKLPLRENPVFPEPFPVRFLLGVQNPILYPHQESNLDLQLRRLLLYPLSYGGVVALLLLKTLRF